MRIKELTAALEAWAPTLLGLDSGQIGHLGAASGLSSVMGNGAVPIEHLRRNIRLSGLAPSIYHYTQLNLAGPLGGGRLAIVR
jgi:hypothetical protein